MAELIVEREQKPCHYHKNRRIDVMFYIRDNVFWVLLNPAEQYPSSGPVAQLGARFHGMEEVVGSIPTRSTNIL